MKQFISFVQKEFFHILRDRRTMLILLVMPVVLIILFGYAITTEVRNSRVAIIDLSKYEMTKQIVQRIDANKYFTVTHDLTVGTERQSLRKETDRLFLSGDVDMVVAFSEKFAENTLHGGNATIQLLADGTEPNQAAVRTGYIQQILATYIQDYASQHQMKPRFTITPVTRMLYNPQSRSEYNFVPGVIGLILMLICSMMTSISIVKEKEMGTMEVLLASPLPPIYIVLAKLVPYFVISCANLATILLLSVFLLDIPIAGSLVGFIAISLLYIVVALSLGLLISSLVNTQLAAMLLSLLLIVPTMYLSGLAFPIESMPAGLQRASVIVPARWYVEIARKLMIQGVELRYVMHETGILAVMAVVLLGISWKSFKIRL